LSNSKKDLKILLEVYNRIQNNESLSEESFYANLESQIPNFEAENIGRIGIKSFDYRKFFQDILNGNFAQPEKIKNENLVLNHKKKYNHFKTNSILRHSQIMEECSKNSTL